MGQINQFPMPKMARQWKIIVENYCRAFLTCNLLDNGQGNIIPWLRKGKSINSSSILDQLLFSLQKFNFKGWVTRFPIEPPLPFGSKCGYSRNHFLYNIQPYDFEFCLIPVHISSKFQCNTLIRFLESLEKLDPSGFSKK